MTDIPEVIVESGWVKASAEAAVKKRGRGRPRGPSPYKTPRKNPVTIRLTDEEYNSLIRVTENAGMDVATMARMIVQRAINRNK
jgi:hypothetical protein